VLELKFDHDVHIVRRADLAIEHGRDRATDEVGDTDLLQAVHDLRKRFAERQRAHPSWSQP
jgi:hypothetical protein